MSGDHLARPLAASTSLQTGHSAQRLDCLADDAVSCEPGQPGASLSEVARRYGIATRVLFRWKQELKPAPMFVTVRIADASTPRDAALSEGERAP